MGRKRVVVDHSIETGNVFSPSRSVQTLTAGSDNTVTVPAGASVVLIVPPKTQHVAWTLKGATGDTGIELAKNMPAGPIHLKSTVADFLLVLAAGADFDVHLEWH